MATNQILGAGTLAGGAVLLVYGYRSTNMQTDQLSGAVTGLSNDGTMWCFAIGIATVVGVECLVALRARREGRRRAGIRLEVRL